MSRFVGKDWNTHFYWIFIMSTVIEPKILEHNNNHTWSHESMSVTTYVMWPAWGQRTLGHKDQCQWPLMSCDQLGVKGHMKFIKFFWHSNHVCKYSHDFHSFTWIAKSSQVKLYVTTMFCKLCYTICRSESKHRVSIILIVCTEITWHNLGVEVMVQYILQPHGPNI